MKNIQTFIEFKRVRDSLVGTSMNWDQLSVAANDSAKLKLLTRTTNITTFDTIYPKKITATTSAAVKRKFFRSYPGTEQA